MRSFVFNKKKFVLRCWLGVSEVFAFVKGVLGLLGPESFVAIKRVWSVRSVFEIILRWVHRISV